MVGIYVYINILKICGIQTKYEAICFVYLEDNNTFLLKFLRLNETDMDQEYTRKLIIQANENVL